MPDAPLDVRTLTDGGQPAAQVAGWLHDFVAAARRSLDVAIYDFALSTDVAAPVVSAFREARARGVAVRFVYNADHPGPIPVPPPPDTDAKLIGSTGASMRAVSGIPDLMHQKYVVRDGADVWTGSTNWTDDAWTREENVVVIVSSSTIASAYTRDFEQLWASGAVQDTGAFDADPDPTTGMRVRFSPGRGRQIAHRIAEKIARASRVRIASPVITSGPILGTLAEATTAGRADIAGVYDATQMNEVLHQWHADAKTSWKIHAVQTVVQHAPFGGKRSTPYAPGSVHDYMHAKVTVADDTVFIGSYNLSHSGEDNAENVLEIRDGDLAGRMGAFVDELRARYRAPALAFD